MEPDKAVTGAKIQARDKSFPPVRKRLSSALKSGSTKPTGYKDGISSSSKVRSKSKHFNQNQPIDLPNEGAEQPNDDNEIALISGNDGALSTVKKSKPSMTEVLTKPHKSGSCIFLKDFFANNPQRSLQFLEEVRASRKMKQLTKKYGSKGKTPKEYFMESYDVDTMIEFPDEGEDTVKGPARNFNWKGEEIKDARSRKVKQEESVLATEDEPEDQQNSDDFPSLLGSPIVFRSLEALLNTAPTGLKPQLFDDDSEVDFWASLQRLEKQQKGERTPSNSILSCDSLDTPTWSVSTHSSNSREYLEEQEEQEENAKEFSYDHTGLDKYLDHNVQEVLQSEAVKREWDLVKLHLEQFDVKDPIAYNLYGNLYEEVCDFVRLPEEDVLEFQAGNWDPPLFEEAELYNTECQEKLMGRFKIFQKGLMFMAEHFETLRPLLAEIRQSYEDVMERCEKEHKDLDSMRLEQLKIKMTYAEHVRATDKIGDTALKETKIQAHVLQQHIQCQQHTVDTMLGMLWKMRQSLKLQTHYAKKTKVDYKNKVETLSREIVNQQGQAMYEMTLPGKYTEIMERFKQIKDPQEIRRILQAARRQLKKTHKQIVIFEADYADTVPRPEYELYLKKYNSLHSKNGSRVHKNKDIEDQKNKIQEHIESMRAKIYQEVGLDETTGERPILYLQTLGKGPTVPVHLRYDKPIVDMKYVAEEAATIIREIWAARSQTMALCRKIKKARDDEQEGIANFPDDLPYDIPDINTFPEFVAEFLLNKAENEDLAMQLSYNVVEACRRNSKNNELNRFLRCLEGSLNESVYHLYHVESTRIQDFVTSKANENKENKGSLSLGDFTKFLKEACPEYRDEEINDLEEAARTHTSARGDFAIPVARFFERTDTLGRLNVFVDLLAIQIEALRREYVTQIQNDILLELGISEKLLEALDDPAWLTDVSMSTFYGAVHSVDPEISEIGMSRYLAWVYLGVTLYPGISTVGTKLFEYIKDKMRAPDYDPDKYNEDDDIEFEDCVRQLKEYEEDDATLDKLEIKKRRLHTKKLKNASLRQVSDRLYSGPFVRFGKRPEPNAMVSTFSEVPSEVQVEEEEEGGRRHRRHHHRRRGSEEERSHRRRRDKEGRRKKSEAAEPQFDVDVD